MLVTPALPWPTGDTGGTIKLSRRVTEQDLLNGILKIKLDNAGREYNASIVKYQDNTLRVVADNDVFIINPIPQSTDTLTLTRVAGEAAQAYSLVNVQMFKGYLAEVFKDEECTQRPQAGDDNVRYLFIRVNKPMMAGDTQSWAPPYRFSKLVLTADATPPASGNQFDITLYEVFKPIETLQEGYHGVFKLDANSDQYLASPVEVNFGSIYE